ncbi:MAG: DeoR family transcriptional regulator [Clostridium fessum]
MHAIERAEYILSMLEKNKVVMVTDLSREMGVTEETVRKDLEKLEKQEKLNRVHGGAYLNEGFGNETPISVRSKVMQEEKKLLASLHAMDPRKRVPFFWIAVPRLFILQSN